MGNGIYSTLVRMKKNSPRIKRTLSSGTRSKKSGIWLERTNCSIVLTMGQKANCPYNYQKVKVSFAKSCKKLRVDYQKQEECKCGGKDPKPKWVKGHWYSQAGRTLCATCKKASGANWRTEGKKQTDCKEKLEHTCSSKYAAKGAKANFATGERPVDPEENLSKCPVLTITQLS